MYYLFTFYVDKFNLNRSSNLDLLKPIVGQL